MKAHKIDALDLITQDRSVTYPDVKTKNGGGTLETYQINEITDSTSYVLPLASSVDEGGWLIVELTDRYSAQTPTVMRAGSDTISDSSGSDTSVIFDGGSMSVRFISDGVSDWRI